MLDAASRNRAAELVLDRGSHRCCLLCSFCFVPLVSGLTMWMPQYFADQSAQDDADGTSDAGGADGSGTGDAGNAMYITAVIGALSALPANLVSMWTVARYGRIKTLVSSLLLSSLCVLMVPLIASRDSAMAMLTVFSGVNTAAWNAINVATTEVYKTEVRATAFGSVEHGETRSGEWREERERQERTRS